MPYNPPRRRRNPEIVHAWLIGTGVPSLAAAVHLICDAKVRASQIHILDADTGPENDVKTSGHLERGYLPVNFSSTLEKCTAELLSNIPSQCLEHSSLLECIVAKNNGKQPPGHESTGFAYWEERGIRKRQHDLRMKDRKDVLKFMLNNELRYDSKMIEELFSQSFFDSGLWNVFSVRFGLQPWHSAIEFHRYLCKYAEFGQRGEIKVSLPAQYDVLASIAQPLEQFLRYQGVHFELGKLVSNLKMLPKSDPIYVSEIEYMKDEKRVSIPVGPDDIVIATLGSITSGSLVGCNRDPPPPISSSAERVLNGYWSLWFRLAKQSSRKFGDPSAFCTHIPQSRMETFTITLWGEESLALHTTLTSLLEENTFVSFSRSNWLLCVVLPQQPGFRAQKGSFTVCGYALSPAAHGNFIKKPMCRCSGEEILFELFTHLGIPFEKTSTTATSVPCLIPFATSMMLIHKQGDRPQVIPPNTTNIAVIGQYSEIKDETAFGIEYSVRSAQMAVFALMGLDNSPPKVNKNVVARRYGDSGLI